MNKETKKVIGLLVIVASLISFSINISLANLSRYVFGIIRGTDIRESELTYMPVSVYIILIITILIGLYLFFDLDFKRKKDK